MRASLAIVLLLVRGASAQAQPAEPLTTRVAEAIAERWGVPAAQLRIEWQQVAEPDYTGAFALQGGTTAEWLVIAQDDARRPGWRLRAGVLEACPVAARDLPRAAVLSSNDIRISPVAHWGVPTADRCSPVGGWVTRRVVRQGEPLAAPAVAPPTAVRSGENVRVTFVRGSVSLVLDARAAGTGAIGDRVLVQMATGKRVTATITGDGTVEYREAR